MRPWELLDSKRSLMKTYMLKGDLKRLWQYRHVGYAMKAWRSWFGRAVVSGVEPIKRMAHGFRDDAYFFPKIRNAVPGDG